MSRYDFKTIESIEKLTITDIHCLNMAYPEQIVTKEQELVNLAFHVRNAQATKMEGKNEVYKFGDPSDYFDYEETLSRITQKDYEKDEQHQQKMDILNKIASRNKQ